MKDNTVLSDEEAAAARQVLTAMAEHLQAGGTLPRCMYVEVSAPHEDTKRVIISKQITLIINNGVPILWLGPSRYELSHYEACRLHHALGEIAGAEQEQASAEAGLEAHEEVPDWKG